MKYVIITLYLVSRILKYNAQSVSPQPFPCRVVQPSEVAYDYVNPGNNTPVNIYNYACLEAGATTGFPFTVFNREVTMVSGTQIDLNAETEIIAEPGKDFYAHIQKQPFNVVWFDPNSTPGTVPQYEKLELGLEMSQSINDRILNFINNSGSDQINPFNPNDIDVKAEFKRAGYSTIYKVYGFYYQEYERDLSDSDPNNWTWTKINTVDNVNTQYNFRVRFAPPEEGVWTCSISITYDGQTQTLLPIYFYVSPKLPDGHGYMSVGSNKRYFELDDNPYFPVGKNIPFPDRSCWVDPESNETDYCTQVGYTETKFKTPAYYLSYLHEITKYHDRGGDYFRMLFYGEDFEIEFEELNNYYDRMNNAWEFDRLVDTARSLGMMIHFNLQVHSALMIPGDFTRFYDWVPSNETPVSPSSPQCAQVAGDNGYCYHTQLGMATPRVFLESPNAQEYYKRRLRYITSRWGYSTNISTFELFSEANNIAKNGYQNYELLNGNWGCVTHADTNLEAYVKDPLQPARLYQWQNTMCQFLKTHQYFPHLTSVSYTGDHTEGIVKGDNSYSSPYVDIASWNFYKGIPAAVNSQQDMTKYYNKLHGKQAIVDGGITIDDINKPIINSELGIGVDDCSQYVRWVKELWVPPFTGHALSMNWMYNHHYDMDFMGHMNRLRQFIAGINFDGDATHGAWEPWYKVRHDKKATAYALVSKEDNKRAIGVVVNNTVNFYTMATGTPCNSIDNLPETYYRNNLKVFPSLGTATTLGDLIYLEGDFGRLKRYTIDWYDPYTLNEIKSVTVVSNLNGNLLLDYPVLSDGVSYYRGASYIVAFKVRRINEPLFFTPEEQAAQQNPLSLQLYQDTVQQGRNKNITNSIINHHSKSDVIKIVPNPTSDICSITYTGKDHPVQLKVINSQGQIINKMQLFGNQIEINLVNEPKGLYLILVETPTKTYFEKIIKQ